MMQQDPDQAQEQAEQGQAGGSEVAKLFQNVGQGLTLIQQYVAKVSPDAQELAGQLLQGYEQLVQQVVQAREGGAPQQGGGPVAQEAGSRQVQQAY